MEEKMLKRDMLHDYQKYCIEFIKTHPQSFLVLQMGLGKTVITLTAILDLMYDSFLISKVLVIAPKRVAESVWPAEVKLWEHTGCLRIAKVLGTRQQREAALLADADIWVINRENVPWLVDYYKENRMPWDFDFVCIDEASSFKNPKSKRWKALCRVRPFIKRIVGLTGTPAGHGLEDLFGEVGIIDGGKRLGRFITRFRTAFFKPAKMNPYTGVVYKYEPLPGAEKEIYKRISDITISMKALDFLKMPEITNTMIPVAMNQTERRVYDMLKDDLLVNLKDSIIDASNAAVLTSRLLEMASGAVYDSKGDYLAIHNRKLEALTDLIEEAAGENVLVAYWFRHDHERIRNYLAEQGYEVMDIKSPESIEKWNSSPGTGIVGLISPSGAGHGLNIQKGGHILIWFTLPWSLELYQQTVARLYRQGQKETVSVQHIICAGTVDEDVMDALKGKNLTQERMISAVRARLNDKK